MSRARNDAHELWYGEYKVEQFRQEEQHQSLAESTENAAYGEGHACEVRERITDEHLRGVPVNEW
jgi:hypothetical protein